MQSLCISRFIFVCFYCDGMCLQYEDKKGILSSLDIRLYMYKKRRMVLPSDVFSMGGGII